METKPKVSVVLPTYNSAHLLDEAIQSVLSQTVTEFEFIILDNCSKDNTDEVVAKYLHDKRISYHKNSTNIGLTGNWNKCIEMASGEYIKFICSDDKFHPQILEKFIPVLDEHPNVSLVGCCKEEFGGKFYRHIIPFHYTQPGAKVVVETMKNYNYLGEPSCVMFRKAAINKVGGFSDFRWITDWELWVRLLTIGDCYIVPELLCFTRNHPGQLTKGIWFNYIHFLEEYYFFKQIRKGHYDLNLSGSEEIIDEAIRLKAASYAQVIPKALLRLGKKEFRKSLRRALRIAYSEKVIGRAFSIFYEKIMWKIRHSQQRKEVA